MRPLIVSAPSQLKGREGLITYDQFIERLRRYSKRSIVDVSTSMLWHSYLNPAWRRQQRDKGQLLHSYAPRVAILGMALASEHRGNHVTRAALNKLMHDYLRIIDPISDEEFRDKEASEVLALLKGTIPDKYLQLEHIRSSCAELFIARVIRSQHEVSMTGLEELLSAYRIFTLLDRRMEGNATAVAETIFNIEPLHFFRSGFMLLAIAGEGRNNGRIVLESVYEEKQLVEKYEINVETCQLVASKISFNESDLRNWHDDVMAVPSLYRKYFPNPLYRHPLIHRDLGRKNIEFLIPAPGLFVRGVINSFFSQMFPYDETLGMLSHFGDAIEEHMLDCLKKILGERIVHRIDGGATHADFKIELETCDLIVETKTALGGYLAQSIMTPEHIKSIWGLLYKATIQCSHSIAEMRTGKRPIYGLVIVADNMTMEAGPFMTFAERSGLFKDLGIEGVEFMSWYRIEDALSKTSVKKFEEAFLQKWQNKDRMTVADAMSFALEPDCSAHSYEYLKPIEQEIFGKDVLSVSPT